MKTAKKTKTTELEFPFGVDISGYVRPDGFEPSVAVLCPHCAEGFAPKNAHYWRQQAELGEPLDARGYESLGNQSGRCESCGDAWYRWAVSEQAEEA